VHTQETRPTFQPPDWVFPIAWTYITIAFGYFTNRLLLFGSHRAFTLVLYALLLGGLNAWLVVYDKRYYKTAFYLLIALTYLSIVYALTLVHNNILNAWLFLPMPFWLVLASCMNGVIYHAHRR
jgi:tryptophan-rich sensory protein